MKRKPLSILFLLSLCFALAVVSVSSFTVAYANVPTLDQIRVALFIDTGKYYRQVVPTVKLSSPNGFTISDRNSQGVVYADVPDGRKVSFGLDQFALLLLETSDLARVKSLVHTLTASSIPSTISVSTQKGVAVYRVTSGSYASESQAFAGAYGLNSIIGTSPTVIGNGRWIVGQFNQASEAAALITRFADQGLWSYSTIVSNPDGTLAYQVRVGDEKDANGLQALRDRLQTLFPDVAVSPVDPSQSFVLVKKSILPSGEPVDHLYYNKDGQKLAVVPKPVSHSVPVVAVAEKGNRQYRGMIELSSYGGNMAVINQLNFEQYLYAVVSSEMAGGWPLEALKAQAVASRTYAVGQGLKYVIAHVSDSTYDQAYKGYTIEKPDVRLAVEATWGQVLMNGSSLANAFYYSNAGGITADPSEVWGGQISYLRPVPSPDEGLLKSTPIWYRLMLTDGTIGYIRSDLVRPINKWHPSKRQYVETNLPNVNFRNGPSTSDHQIVRTLNLGQQGIILEEVYQNSSYSWVSGPVNATGLMQTINERTTTGLVSPVFSLQVTKRGPSGRVTELSANGRPIVVSSPNAIRTALGGSTTMRSTLFEVEQMGSYTVLGAGGKTIRMPKTNPNVLYAISAGGKVKKGLNGAHDEFFILGNQDRTRIATESLQYRFHGKGFGHGLGMSQYGAKGMAENGYDYVQILKHYYSEQVTITPATQ